MNMEITLQPFAGIERSLLVYLRKNLETTFSAEVSVNDPMEIPEDSYNENRGQYLSHRFLERMEPIRKTGMVLGITHADLYVPDLNFVFGTALPYEKVAVISMARLEPEFHGSKPDEELFKKRALKEAVHELGHLLGLSHCPNFRCVMHFSNSLGDTDRKSAYFCRRCAKKAGLS